MAGAGYVLVSARGVPLPSVPAETPGSARAARAAAREARSRESSPRANLAGGEAPAAPADVLSPIEEGNTPEVDVVDVVPGGSNAGGDSRPGLRG